MGFFNLFDAYIFWTKNDKKTHFSAHLAQKTHFLGKRIPFDVRIDKFEVFRKWQ